MSHPPSESPDSRPDLTRCVVVFTGRVQGVGFRWTARSVAQRFPITGFVRNEPDRSVHLVAEGSRAEITAYLAALRSRMEEFILNEVTAWESPTGEFATFDIRK